MAEREICIKCPWVGSKELDILDIIERTPSPTVDSIAHHAKVSTHEATGLLHRLRDMELVRYSTVEKEWSTTAQGNTCYWKAKEEGYKGIGFPPLGE